MILSRPELRAEDPSEDQLEIEDREFSVDLSSFRSVSGSRTSTDGPPATRSEFREAIRPPQATPVATTPMSRPAARFRSVPRSGSGMPAPMRRRRRRSRPVTDRRHVRSGRRGPRSEGEVCRPRPVRSGRPLPACEVDEEVPPAAPVIDHVMTGGQSSSTVDEVLDVLGLEELHHGAS